MEGLSLLPDDLLTKNRKRYNSTIFKWNRSYSVEFA